MLATIAVVLGVVKWTSISGAPSSHDATVAIPVAQGDLFEAKRIRSGEKNRFNDAEAALKNSRLLLKLLGS